MNYKTTGLLSPDDRHSPLLGSKYLTNNRDLIRASTVIIFLLLSFQQFSCDTANSSPPVMNAQSRFVELRKHSATVVMIDKSLSARKTYAIPMCKSSELQLLIHQIANNGGGDLYLYYIDENGRDNAPLYIQIPPELSLPMIPPQKIGDESYNNDVSEIMEKFHADSITAALKVQEVIDNYMPEIESFIRSIYQDNTTWTDVIGTINSAIEVLNSSVYDNYDSKTIIAFSDLEQSLPEKSKYKPTLLPIPSNISIYMVAGTSGQSPIITKFTRVATFNRLLTTFNQS